MAELKAPFVYFGGKRSVADQIWRRFGPDCTNYVEPFAGSCAVLLARPQPFQGVETVNDVNAYVSNFWRCVSRCPEAVVDHCDWPVNELDLHARHRWLVLSPEAIEFRERLRCDPDYCDPKIAGWWVWGSCCWIGGGWCQVDDGQSHHKKRPAINQSANGGHRSPHAESEANQPRKKPRTEGDNPGSCGKGIHGTTQHVQIPDLSSGGCGIAAASGLAAKVPRLTNDVSLRAGSRQGGRPQLADAYDVGRGVNSNGDLGTCEARRQWLLDWFGRLRDRLRLVRVCCGHWSRVCESESVTTRLGTTAVFLDPPYPIRRKSNGKRSRSGGLYQGDRADELDLLRDEVLAWCVDRGDDRRMRICLACYEDDGYEVLEREYGWRVEAWTAQGGYANRSENKGNRERERLYYSPGCLFEASLFDGVEG